MVVVIGIIVLLLAATIPGLSSIWQQRKESEIVTTLSGALGNARAQSLKGVDRGLFFCVVDGIQKAYPIERYDALENKKGPPGTPPSPSTVVDRFRIAEGNVLTFPEPLRVAPRNVLDSAPPKSSWEVWNDAELVSNDYADPTIDEPQHHRNFFTIIFGHDGRQLTGVDVLVYDCDSCDNTPSADGIGDVTGLPIGQASSFDPFGGPGVDDPIPVVAVEDMIVDSSTSEAINFVSVDGLLIYDEKEFSDSIYPSAVEKRDYLKNKGKPLYISRNTGKVLIGPDAEN